MRPDVSPAAYFEITSAGRPLMSLQRMMCIPLLRIENSIRQGLLLIVGWISSDSTKTLMESRSAVLSLLIKSGTVFSAFVEKLGLVIFRISVILSLCTIHSWASTVLPSLARTLLMDTFVTPVYS